MLLHGLRCSSNQYLDLQRVPDGPRVRPRVRLRPSRETRSAPSQPPQPPPPPPPPPPPTTTTSTKTPPTNENENNRCFCSWHYWKTAEADAETKEVRCRQGPSSLKRRRKEETHRSAAAASPASTGLLFRVCARGICEPAPAARPDLPPPAAPGLLPPPPPPSTCELTAAVGIIHRYCSCRPRRTLPLPSRACSKPRRRRPPPPPARRPSARPSAAPTARAAHRHAAHQPTVAVAFSTGTAAVSHGLTCLRAGLLYGPFGGVPGRACAGGERSVNPLAPPLYL